MELESSNNSIIFFNLKKMKILLQNNSTNRKYMIK